MRQQLKHRGFTLIEVLIAMAITAMVATLAFASLDSTLDSVEGLRDQGERISEVNRAWVLISRDLEHFVNRSVRNEFGSVSAAVMGGEVVDQTLAFTRTGWHNTTGRVRSNMQRVRYVLEDTTLYREHFLVLDRSSESEPLRVALLEDVTRMEFRFLTPGTQLPQGVIETENWPEAWAVGASGEATPPPEALEIRLELEDWGEVRWLYELPTPR
jgi:general secretion pathway protein J